MTSPDERFTDSMVDLVERERIAVNETFAAHGLAWNWSPEVHNSLRRVGGIKRQFDEYGFRTGDLLTYQQLVLLEADVIRRVDTAVVDVRSAYLDEAWVA